MDRPVPDRELEENSEQDDSGAQAQDVADDAVTRSIDLSAVSYTHLTLPTKRIV